MRPHVVTSVNNDEGNRCVDVFQRADGSYGFEEYRRDVESREGWFPIGGHAGGVFASADEAQGAAWTRVSWLGGVLGRGA